MLYLMAAFRTYLRRNKLISENNRKSYNNFLNLLNAIYKSIGYSSERSESVGIPRSPASGDPGHAAAGGRKLVAANGGGGGVLIPVFLLNSNAFLYNIFPAITLEKYRFMDRFSSENKSA